MCEHCGHKSFVVQSFSVCGTFLKITISLSATTTCGCQFMSSNIRSEVVYFQDLMKYPQWWSSGYCASLLTQRSWYRIPAAVATFRWSENARGPCTVRCQCTLNNPRCSKFLKPSSTSSFITMPWFWKAKSRKLLLGSDELLFVVVRGNNVLRPLVTETHATPFT